MLEQEACQATAFCAGNDRALRGADRRRCPYREHALISRQEHEAWEVLLACQAQLRLAASGHVIGIDSLQQLADAVGLSRSHFARAFKKSTGVSPHRWLLDRRIERAQDLLLNSKLSIDRADRDALRLRRPESSHLGLRQTRACGSERMAAMPAFIGAAGLATNLADLPTRRSG
jgi:AraC-like DNA-binding protein